MKMRSTLLTLVVAFFSFANKSLAAPSLGATSAMPTTITVGQPTTVIVTSVITDPSLITTGINLLRLNANGSSTVLAQLHDDGVNGDAIAGDKTFSVQVILNEASPGSVQLEVSAAFKGVLRRSLSNIITVTVTASSLNPPTIVANISPAPNLAGWNNSDVTVVFTCSDSNSGIRVCPGPTTVSNEGANQVITGTAKSNAGLTATSSVSINLDKTPPTVLATLSPVPNASGWNNSDVTVSYACSDSLSGVTTCPSPSVVSGEGTTIVTSPTVTDVAGNSASAGSLVRLDKTAPEVSISTPAENSNVFASPTAVTGTVSDAGSGIASATCNAVSAQVNGANFTCDLGLSLGVNTVDVEAADIAGNTSTATAQITLVGKPVVTITSPANLSFTSLSPITVRGTVDDPNATVGVNGVSAPLDGGAFSVPVPLNEGSNTLTALAQNAGGNQGTARVVITLDTTPPHLAITSPANGSATTEASVSVSGIVNDIVVGTVNDQDAQVTVNGVAAAVANRTFSADIPLNLGDNTIQAVARDRVGNSTSVSISLTRLSASQPPAPLIGDPLFTNSLTISSGDRQSGAIGSPLVQSLTVFLHDPQNNPVPNQAIVFRVTGGGGTLNTGGAGSPSVAVDTDANGRASALLTLGQRSGAGSNTVEASNVFSLGPVEFSETADPGPPSAIVVDSGDNQTGAAGQALTFPFVAVVTDAGHNRVAGIPVTFTVSDGAGNLNSAPNQVVTTDSDGRAQAVLTLDLAPGKNMVEATFPNNASPVGFTALGKVAGDPSKTTVSGIVLDDSNTPIPDVTMRLYQTNQGNNNNLPVQIGQPVKTASDGSFVIQSAPVGHFKLMADGTTASTGTFPSLEYDITTVAGNDNTVGSPIYLPVLDNINKLCVDQTHGGTLTLPQSPGFSLRVLPGSATFPGGTRTGCVSVSTVHGDKVPMTPGFGQQPRFIVTIQPVGTTFNPPAAITFPNVDGLPPRAKTEMYSYDHDLSTFVAIGTATVSDDGSVIASDPGVGVLKAGWHCGGDPKANGHVADCGECNICNGNHCVANESQTNPGQPNPCNGGSPSFNLSFNNGGDTVHVSVGPTCRGYCAKAQNGKGVCVTSQYSMQQIKTALQGALEKIFNNDSSACIEDSLRYTMQNNLRTYGVNLVCRPPDPNDASVCSEVTNAGTNVVKLRPGAFTDPACGDPSAVILHELVHGVGNDTGAPDSAYHDASMTLQGPDCRDRPYGCEESCFGKSTGGAGNPIACQLTPAEMTQEIQSGYGSTRGCSPCKQITFIDTQGSSHTETICPTAH